MQRGSRQLVVVMRACISAIPCGLWPAARASGAKPSPAPQCRRRTLLSAPSIGSWLSAAGLRHLAIRGKSKEAGLRGALMNRLRDASGRSSVTVGATKADGGRPVEAVRCQRTGTIAGAVLSADAGLAPGEWNCGPRWTIGSCVIAARCKNKFVALRRMNIQNEAVSVATVQCRTVLQGSMIGGQYIIRVASQNMATFEQWIAHPEEHGFKPYGELASKVVQLSLR